VKTDAFAFGIVLIELLTELDPIKARNMVDFEGEMSIASALYTNAKERKWPKAVAKSLSDLAAACVSSTKMRKIPAEIERHLQRANALCGGAQSGGGGRMFGLGVLFE
jgi:hypothetical protein